MPLVESFSGIRGIYDDGIDEKVAVRYGYAYLSFLKKKHGDNVRIVLGTDTRPSKDMLKNALIESLNCEIIDLDIASTPMVEFAVRHYKADGGVVVTASHNEPYWNGFKFLGNDGAVLREKDMNQVMQNFRTSPFKNFHKIQERKILEKNTEAIKEYEKFVLEIIGNKNANNIKNSGQKIIIDPNGGAGAIAKNILKQLNVDAVGVNMAYGEFSRAIEPNEDSLFYLKNAIDEENADFAAGF